MVELRIEGLERISKIAGAVQSTTPKLRPRLLAGIRAVGKPIVADIREEASSSLPHGGGLNEWVAKSNFGIRSRTSGITAGIRIVGQRSGHDLDVIDRGRVRHPLFGNRKSWFQESVKPGFFSRPAEASETKAQTAVLKVMDEFAAEIHRKASS